MRLPISYQRIAKLVLEDLLQKQNKNPASRRDSRL
jgi:hypothetical protein